MLLVLRLCCISARRCIGLVCWEVRELFGLLDWRCCWSRNSCEFEGVMSLTRILMEPAVVLLFASDGRFVEDWIAFLETRGNASSGCTLLPSFASSFDASPFSNLDAGCCLMLIADADWDMLLPHRSPILDFR